jgi:hypothetical protein
MMGMRGPPPRDDPEQMGSQRGECRWQRARRRVRIDARRASHQLHRNPQGEIPEPVIVRDLPRLTALVVGPFLASVAFIRGAALAADRVSQKPPSLLKKAGGLARCGLD